MTIAWTFERVVSVLNLGAILAGVVFAAIEFGPRLTVTQGQATASKQTPTIPSGHLYVDDIKACNDGSHLFRLVYNVGTKNASPYPINITYSIEEIYIGNLTTPKLPMHFSYKINDSPTPFTGAGAGQISWHRITYDAYEIGDNVPEPVSRFLNSHYNKINIDRGLTGAVAAGSSIESEIPFIFRALPGEYVGVSYVFGLNDQIGSDNTNVGEVDETRLLESTVKHASSITDDC